MLIENITASFQMEEILYELREHSAGLNCGIWDYSASFIARCVLLSQIRESKREITTWGRGSLPVLHTLIMVITPSNEPTDRPAGRVQLCAAQRHGLPGPDQVREHEVRLHASLHAPPRRHLPQGATKEKGGREATADDG